MNAGGGVQQYSWGVQKVKGRKEERGARVGPVLDWVWVGSTREPRVGSGEV